MAIKFTDEQKKAIKEAIKAYYLDERDEEIGMLHLEGLYDLFVDTVAPLVYNKALDDAKYWYTRRLNDIEGDYYELYKETEI